MYAVEWTEKQKGQSIGIDFETIENLRFTECQMQHLLVLFSAFFKAFSEQCLHNYFSKLYISLNLMFSYKNVPIRETITDYLLIMGMLTII